MTFLEKIKSVQFWANFIKITLPFFIILTVIMLFWKSWSEIFAGDFVTVSKMNFDNGKWKPFFGIKIVASVLYGLYTTNKNMK
tara:strand:+ start:1973 stop:2221 length:249 start_codon:yes stop_codon:yes gene_type:complete